MPRRLAPAVQLDESRQDRRHALDPFRFVIREFDATELEVPA
jgi:hypothetical protein